MATKPMGTKTAKKAAPAKGLAKTQPAAMRKAAAAKTGAKTMTAAKGAAGAPAKKPRLTRPQLAARKAAATLAAATGADSVTIKVGARKAAKGTAMGLATGKGAA